MRAWERSLRQMENTEDENWKQVSDINSGSQSSEHFKVQQVCWACAQGWGPRQQRRAALPRQPGSKRAGRGQSEQIVPPLPVAGAQARPRGSPEAIPEVPTAAESGPSLAPGGGRWTPFLVTWSGPRPSCWVQCACVRQARTPGPGPRSGSSDARGSSPGCLLRCLSATILLPLQHRAERASRVGSLSPCYPLHGCTGQRGEKKKKA